MTWRIDMLAFMLTALIPAGASVAPRLLFLEFAWLVLQTDCIHHNRLAYRERSHTRISGQPTVAELSLCLNLCKEPW